MATARELLEEADALMRRNRARAVDSVIPELTEVIVAAPPSPAVRVDERARRDVLAAEIWTQVLQRIDLFTDTGLREQLGVRMQPIIERASAEMVATINQQVGSLLRACIADAIEREIESWRKGNT